eukprot:356917-Pelagomonas_calceolata.AAC.1
MPSNGGSQWEALSLMHAAERQALAGVVLLLTSSLRLILRSIQCELTSPRGGSRWYIWVRRARSNQISIRAAGGAPSLIRNAGFKEAGRYNTVRDLLSDVQVMLSQT